MANDKDGRVVIEVDVDTGETEKAVEDQRKQVAKLAQEYKKQGMTASDAMKKAWEEVKKGEDALGDLGEQAKKTFPKIGDLAGVFEKVGTGLGNAVKGTAGAVGKFFGELLTAGEVTREYREDQAKLEAAFTTAGHSAEQAGETYSTFYAILGEADRSVEAVNHLAKLTDSQEDLSKWGDIAAGVSATFGDSLPIEGLTEAANETAKTGKIVGQLSDALQWAGITEADFQKALDECNSEQERAALVTDTLNGLYSDAAENYKTLNADVMETQRAQAALTDAYADLGAVAEPILADLKTLAADLLTEITPFVSVMGTELQGMLDGTAGAADRFADALSGMIGTLLDRVIDAMPQILGAGADILNGIIQGILGSLDELIPAALDVVLMLIDTLIENLPLIIDAALQLMIGLALGLVEAIPVILEKIPDIIESIVSALLEMDDVLIEAGLKLFVSLISALPRIIASIVSVIPDIISSIVQALLGNSGVITEAGAALISKLWEGILSLSEWIGNNISQFFSGLVFAAVDTFSAIVGYLEEIFGNILDFLLGVFTGDWQRAWDGVSGYFKAVWNSIVGAMESAVNIIIRGVNFIIGALNRISFDVPDWVPGIGGMSFGFNIAKIGEIELPRLATGAVVPPNREFMALLGDNKQETEIVSPLSTMKQAFIEAMQATGGGVGEQIVVLEVDGREFGRAVFKANKTESRRIGMQLAGV